MYCWRSIVIVSPFLFKSDNFLLLVGLTSRGVCLICWQNCCGSRLWQRSTFSEVGLKARDHLQLPSFLESSKVSCLLQSCKFIQRYIILLSTYYFSSKILQKNLFSMAYSHCWLLKPQVCSNFELKLICLYTTQYSVGTEYCFKDLEGEWWWSLIE